MEILEGCPRLSRRWLWTIEGLFRHRARSGEKVKFRFHKRVFHPYAVVTKRKISTYELPFGSVIGPRSPQ